MVYGFSMTFMMMLLTASFCDMACWSQWWTILAGVITALVCAGWWAYEHVYRPLAFAQALRPYMSVASRVEFGNSTARERRLIEQLQRDGIPLEYADDHELNSRLMDQQFPPTPPDE